MDSPVALRPPACGPQSPRDALSIRSAMPATPLPLAALVFDLGHVLYDPTPWQRWLLQLLNRVGLHTHYEAFFRTFERDHLQAVYCGEGDYWDALRSFLLEAGLSRGRLEEVLAAGHGKYRELWENVRPLPGVVGTLAQLSARGIRLAVLSNSASPAPRLVQKLEQLTIASRFELVLSSRDLGVAKPDLECYQAVIDALALEPEQIGFVGHEALDLAGGGLAGMMTFAINNSPDVQADVYLDRFEQLQRLILPPQRHQRAG